jgi:uncharacterized protein (UPF0264 family)
MRLLVSVAEAADARAAIDGGADIIDIKDPRRDALAAVSESQLRAITAEVGGERPVSVALGDIGGSAWSSSAGQEGGGVAGLATAAPAAGAAFLKLGFAVGVTSSRAHWFATRLMARVAPRASRNSCQIVVAAYADASPKQLDRFSVLDVADRCGAAGVLLDTREKRGRGLFDVLSGAAVAAWVETAHDADLMVALAGSLRAEDLAVAREVGADLVGVRGAACEGGRAGRVSVSRVRALVAAMEASPEPGAGFRIAAVRPSGSLRREAGLH